MLPMTATIALVSYAQKMVVPWVGISQRYVWRRWGQVGVAAAVTIGP
jgi:outer membrane protease